MSATEWKFVPVEPTIEMVAALGFDGDVDMTIGHGAISAEIVSVYTNMLDAAPVQPSVESLLENWTPSDQQAFARFRDEHFPGEMSSYAIQSLGLAWKDGQANASTEVPQYTGTGSDTLDCILGVGGFASFGPLDAQPAAHLTIPGALEWDGDNGTHGAGGESRAHGEQEISDDDLLKMADKAFGQVVDYDLSGNPITDYRVLTIGAYGPAIRRLVSLARQHPVAPVAAYTAVDMTTAAADGFRDGQTAATESLKAFANELIAASFEGGSFDGGDIQDIAVKHGLLQIEQRTEECGEVCACREYGFPAECYRKTDLLKPVDEPADPAKCESCGGWGHIETEDSAHDCPECGPSVIERAVEAGVMNAPAAAAVTDDRPSGCCCPPKGHAGIWAAAMCPVHMGFRRLASQAVNREQFKHKTCIECDQPYCHGVCVERGDQDYDRDQAAKGGDDE